MATHVIAGHHFAATRGCAQGLAVRRAVFGRRRSGGHEPEVSPRKIQVRTAFLRPPKHADPHRMGTIYDGLRPSKTMLIPWNELRSIHLLEHRDKV
jgi:hypothetical protein